MVQRTIRLMRREGSSTENYLKPQAGHDLVYNGDI
jgi:hypothetical protein